MAVNVSVERVARIYSRIFIGLPEKKMRKMRSEIRNASVQCKFKVCEVPNAIGHALCKLFVQHLATLSGTPRLKQESSLA